MATNEPIAKRLTELQTKLTERAGAVTDAKNGDRALMLESLALLAEGLAKLGRDVRGLKGGKAKAGGASAAGAKAKAPGAKAGAKGKGAKKGLAARKAAAPKPETPVAE